MYNLKILKNTLFILGSLLIFQWGFSQYKIPEKPGFQTSVYDDEVKLLSASQKAALENKLIKYADTTTTQIVVAIISSTEGEDIDYLGAQWGQKWGIGQANEDNGVLIILAKDDRQVGISTGYGTEHLLTDAISKRIIQNVMIPEFKKGDYYTGLDRGTDVIFQVMQGEYKGTRQSNSEQFPPGKFIFLFFIFIVIIIILSKGRRNGGGGNRGNRSPGLDLMDIIILSNMGRGGYKGSSGGFGGFGGGTGGFGGGFGGGGFGGGGASGSW
ncbi:TPM domain-containing protein [Abyssalbus ytuae]|uniref:TPM domain-containing protein n=1 Tax=Abyssalbus ytuae TaxID=2926907 RepID=A0A9E7D463_9FLAO|nr:TPM domain-containing protein [Abyssalbus ytuae]UOB18564.1 TPM domain-containing protein [Abyssalbus ytuae]